MRLCPTRALFSSDSNLPIFIFFFVFNFLADNLMIRKLISTFRFRSQFKRKKKTQHAMNRPPLLKNEQFVLHHDHVHACILCFLGVFFVSLQMHPNSETSTTLKRKALVEK